MLFTSNQQPVILLTIDVEDWFQVENFKPWIPFSTWGDRELRVERNVHRLLDLFDSFRGGQRGQRSEVRCQMSEGPDVGLPGEALKERRRDVGCPMSEGKDQMSDVRGQRSEGKDRMSEVGCQMSEGKDQRSEDSLPRRSSERAKTGGQRSEGKDQMSDVGGQMSEGKDQMSDVGSQKSVNAVNEQPGAAVPTSNLQPATSNQQPATAVLTSNRPSIQQPATSNQQRNLTHQPKIRATFFVLGWIAERLPHMVREIHDRGHEVGSHGLDHELPSKMSEKDLLDDLVRSREMLENLIGARVYGYRAPSFAIDDAILDLIRQAGYLYDSSYNSFSLHGRYGHVNLNGCEKYGIAHRVTEGFYQMPLSNLTVLGKVFPLGGGGYFRLLPLIMMELGVRSILEKTGAYCFYMHPWEIDPEQPRVHEASRFRRFRHYSNLKNTLGKLTRLIIAMKTCAFLSITDYLESVGCRTKS